MSVETRKTPLDGARAPTTSSARLAEGRPRGMITLKGDHTDPAVAGAVTAAIGLAPPSVRRYVAEGENGALWMAPDELLILAPFGEVGAKINLLEETAGGAVSLVDMSDARAVVQIAGPTARETLAKVAPIDLHPAMFTVGDVRRTQIGHVAGAMVQVSSAPETFEVYCFRSVAAYVWDLLAASSDAASEIGVFADVR